MFESKLNDCPICGNKKIIAQFIGRNDSDFVECPRCGAYTISGDFRFADQKMKLREVASSISGYVRWRNENGIRDTALLTSELDELLKQDDIPAIDEIDSKAEYLLRAVKKRTTRFGEVVAFNLFTDLSLAFAADVDEFKSLFKFLEDNQMLEIINRQDLSGGFPVKLTPQGF